MEPKTPPIPPHPIGTRLYNGGDQANPAHFGTIVSVIPPTPSSSLQYIIKPDPDSIRTNEYRIDANVISPTYDGTGTTRIVLKVGYDRWRKQQMETHHRRRGLKKRKENALIFKILTNKGERILSNIEFDTKTKMLNVGDYVVYEGEIYTVEHITKDTLLLEFYNGTEDMEDLDIKLNIDHYI